MEQQERADRIRRQNMSACMRTAREFMREEDAVGVVEIILILVVLISLVIILRYIAWPLLRHLR